MRDDALGFFWQDQPVVKKAAEPKPKRTPPEKTWLRADYLPGLAEALAFNYIVMDDDMLLAAKARHERMIFDVEVYRNYFLCAFTSLVTGHVAYVEMSDDQPELNINRLGWILQNFVVVGFNSYHYDIPMLSLALAGKTCAEIKEASNRIIVMEERYSDVLRSMKVKKLNGINHIDLIEVAPGVQAGLKTYGGRLHVPRMQDLPFHPEATLSFEQMAITRWYCVNDLCQTAFLHESLKEELALRDRMSEKYGVDLRSKSDAQIAEAVIGEGVERLNGRRPQKPEIAPGTVYRYTPPEFIKFHTPLLNWALNQVCTAPFVVGEHGAVVMPEAVANLSLKIADNTYTMGIGGLHSTEEKAAYQASATTFIKDRDATSFYPKIILSCGLYPKHLGRNFLRIYGGIVDDRIRAKVAKQKADANSLKIVVNGSFGKLGNKYSILYSPDLLIQVTLTGQLALLMLIERAALMGFTIISANTDGVVITGPKAREHELDAMFKQWELETGFETEETQYSAYYGRDVNNYVAIKVPDEHGVRGTKLKGVYANPWNEPKPSAERLKKNPVGTICMDAVEALLTQGTPIATTIRQCNDVRKFVVVRKVKGGAVKDGVYLGGNVRWYYAEDEKDKIIIYARSGNKVPRTEGAKPCMTLPTELPLDIDYSWYESEVSQILQDIGYGACT